jgi:4-hydroxybenzoate polyprenyltransferase
MLTRSDIRFDLLSLLPGRWRPYASLARLDRPIGTWLLLLPCWWGLALAGNLAPLPYLMFAVGAVAMRGAGCTINDLADIEFDRQVARTAQRPLPSGQVSKRQALVFLAAQMVVGLAVLLTFNTATIFWALGSVAIITAYPFMKRVTYWPQVVLGLAFNWGALLGWTASFGALHWPALALYAAGILWTLGYDTIYAHQDKDDDARIGVKSTALRFGSKTKTWIGGFYSAALVLIALACWGAGIPHWATALAIIGMGGHFLWQLAWLDIDNPANCLSLFRANRFSGGLVLLPLLLAGALT